MESREKPEEYEGLVAYAKRKDVNVHHLHGAIHALGIEIQLLSGCYIINAEARAKLDPVVAKIHASRDAAAARGLRGHPNRPRKPRTASA